MRASIIATLLVAVTVIPMTSAAELQTSVTTETAPTATVKPSAGADAGSDVGVSVVGVPLTIGTDETKSTSTTGSANVTTTVPPEYYSLASGLTQSLCDALSYGVAAVIDCLRGQAYHEPRPEDVVFAVVLSAVKAVLNQVLHQESFQKPLNEFHLALVQFIGPNATVMQLLSAVTAELQENLKEAIKSFGPIAMLYDHIENALESASGNEKSAYENAKSELDNMVTNLTKYASDIFCMLLSKCFPGLQL